MKISQSQERQIIWDEPPSAQSNQKFNCTFLLLLLIAILIGFILSLSIISASVQIGSELQSNSVEQISEVPQQSQLNSNANSQLSIQEKPKQAEPSQQSTNSKQQKETPNPQQLEKAGIQKQKETKQKKLVPFNFRGAISAKQSLIDRIESSMNFHQCLQIEPMFHSQDYRQYKEFTMVMYFQTYYQIILPSCEDLNNNKWSVSKQNLKKWNKDRFGIEWGLYNIQEKNNVLYYRGGVYNLPEILMLSKMVGPNGTVTVLEDFKSQKCIGETLSLSGMTNNIKYLEINKITSFQSFNAIIANETLFTKLAFKPNTSTRFLIYAAGNGAKLKENDIFKVFKIQKFVLADDVCGKGIFQQSLSGQGFYSVNALEPKNRKLLKKSIDPKSKFGALQPKYVEFRQNHKKKLATQLEILKSYEKQSVCIDPNSNRNSSSSILTIYGHQLFDVKLEQVLKWEEERQAIEWLRSNKQKSKSVYYEMKYSFNLLAIVQISFMIGQQSSLFVACSQADSCGKLKTQIEKNQLKNVKVLKESSKNDALSAHIIITDNQGLMKACAQTGFLEKGLILGFFDSKRNQSVLAMRKLYIRNQLKQITTPNSKIECAGFKYLHYFWNHETPNGFYQIKPTFKYVIYSFWGDSPKKLNEKKKFLINQLATEMDLQVKIITAQAFKHFQVEGTPIHPAYNLLTSTHKSDYFRVYMMNLYGGAYADVKHTHFKWMPYFEQLYKNQTKYACGYGQVIYIQIPCYDFEPPACVKIRQNYLKMIGNAHYIFKKQSPLTQDWFNAMTNNLNNKYEVLKKNPPRVPRQNYAHGFRLKDGSYFVSQYPFRWAEIANEYLARMQYKYLDHIIPKLPYVITVDYRTESNLDQS